MTKQQDIKRAAKARLSDFVLTAKSRPVLTSGIIGAVLILFVILSGEEEVKTHELATNTIEFEKPKEQMTGIKESIDPRDVWTADLSQKVQDSNKDFSQKLDQIDQQQNAELVTIKEELNKLKESFVLQQEAINQKALEDSLALSNAPAIIDNRTVRKKTKSIGLFSKEYGNKKKNTKDYITSGTFARGVLMTGVVVGTGSNTQSNPEPLMIRLADGGIFSKGKRTEQIKEAILIGDCSGDLSSERAKCRLQTLSLENYKGEIIERKVQGWIVGEDGRYGVKGIVVDKSSDMLRMAMLNGVLGGMSSFLKNQSTKGIFPISPISGQQNALSSVSQLKGGAASGAGDAFSKMADFVMERFNSMTPQIVIASGREVDVVFQHGVDLNEDSDLGSVNTKIAEGNLQQGSYYANGDDKPVNNQNKQYTKYGSEAFGETVQQMNNGIAARGKNDGF